MKKLAFLLIAVLCPILMLGQNSRDYIKQAMKKWDNCRNVAITKTGGDIALSGKNGYSFSGIPTDLANAIKELKANDEYIDDIQLTEDGRWLILYGNNGFRWNDVPYSLENKMREFNSKQEVITSVTFNDNGDWIIISNKLYCASSQSLMDLLKDGNEKNGAVWTAHMTNDGVAVVYSDGYNFMGNVPENLKSALRSTKLDVARLKFLSNGSYFFADQKGNYSAYM